MHRRETMVSRLPDGASSDALLFPPLSVETLYKYNRDRKAFRLNHKGPLMAAVSGSGSQYSLLVYDFKKAMVANSSIGVGFLCGFTAESRENFYDASENVPMGVDVSKQVGCHQPSIAVALIPFCMPGHYLPRSSSWMTCRTRGGYNAAHPTIRSASPLPWR